MRPVLAAITAAVLLCIIATAAAGQTPATQRAKPTFEVAAVKPNKSGDRGVSMSALPGGRYLAINVTLESLILNAYDLQRVQTTGLPEWARSEHFDVIAKAETDFPTSTERPTLLQLMLRSLLEERFALAAHFETREVPAYALVVARTDGTLGASLKASPVDCEALAAARRAGQAVPQQGLIRPCVMRAMPGKLVGGSITMANLARSLGFAVQRIVVDRTGLTGGFDIDVTYAPEQSADTSVPSIFTALQEQLGLKLEPERLPVEMLVIDHVDRPTPD